MFSMHISKSRIRKKINGVMKPYLPVASFNLDQCVANPISFSILFTVMLFEGKFQTLHHLTYS